MGQERKEEGNFCSSRATRPGENEETNSELRESGQERKKVGGKRKRRRDLAVFRYQRV